MKLRKSDISLENKLRLLKVTNVIAEIEVTVDKLNYKLDRDEKRISNLKELGKRCQEWSTERHKDKNLENNVIRNQNVCSIGVLEKIQLEF